MWTQIAFLLLVVFLWEQIGLVNTCATLTEGVIPSLQQALRDAVSAGLAQGVKPAGHQWGDPFVDVLVVFSAATGRGVVVFCRVMLVIIAYVSAMVGGACAVLV